MPPNDAPSPTRSTPPPFLPLYGLRILDLSRVLAGPYCAMLLGDLGAEVIKVERPGSGDITRAWGPPFVGGESAYYLCCNRNKRSIAIDLATSEGAQQVRRLAGRADVVIENFRHGALDRLGLGWASLQADNPALIGCSISGYGRTGPDRDLGGYDVVIQGASGFMSITGDPAGEPMKVGVAVVDILTALFAANAILAALYARQAARTAAPGAPPIPGPIIDMALMDCALAGLANVAQSSLVTGQAPVRHGNAHPNIVPYQLFVGQDHQYFIVALGSDDQWPQLCRVLGAPELAADPAFRTNALRVTNRAVLVPRLDVLFRTKPAIIWIEALTGMKIPCGPVNSLPEILREPQTHARGMVQSARHPGLPDLQLIANPIRYLATGSVAPAVSPPVRRHPPRLDEHRAEILQELDAPPLDPPSRLPTGASRSQP